MKIGLVRIFIALFCFFFSSIAISQTSGFVNNMKDLLKGDSIFLADSLGGYHKQCMASEAMQSYIDSIIKMKKIPSGWPMFTNPESLGSDVESNIVSQTLILSIALLVFGIFVLGFIAWILVRKNQGWGTNTTRIFGISLIIISSIFLITAGFSQQQISPVIGLLGTIAGYLLGKSEKAE